MAWSDRGVRSVALFVLLLLPGIALAHSPIKGLNHFYNGFLHPLFVPAHLLCLLALGLLFGQQGPREHTPSILAFLAATVFGWVGTLFFDPFAAETVLLAGAALLGLLIAARRVVPVYLSAVLGAVLGVAIGLDSGLDELSGNQRLASLLGSGIGIYLLLLYPMALADYFGKRPWQQVAVRVMGSWIAASALLVLSLAILLPQVAQAPQPL